MAGVERENPPGGGRWPNNGEVDEAHRQECLRVAADLEAKGEAEHAAKFRGFAEEARRRRNRAYNNEQRRLAGMRARHGRF